MATLAFSVAGQAIGGAIGGPFGALLGRTVGALAGSLVDNALFGEPDRTRTAGRDIRLQGASEGGAVPRIYGWNRVAGNIIWATELERIVSQSAGGKGTSQTSTEETITANFAVAFAEGEVSHLGRVWADGELLDIEGLNVRFYNGSETQGPDSLIAAKQGADNAPAYRGICYMVFERLPLDQFGNRIPNISVELCRAAGDLERDIRAITVIPGATEFGYDPVPRLRVLWPGTVTSENAHVVGQVSDWTLSIDELQALCPNLQHVALVIAWFGDDLRCGSCNIQPRVEGASRTINGTDWRVSGLTRGEVPVVSSHDGGPAYGGTPSDNAVLAAIADLKARGLKVALYPFVLMDVPEGNSLIDPYTQTSGQPAYPWRGRVTCDPAPGLTGTPDKTAAIDAPVTAFFGGAENGHFSAGNGTVDYSGPVDWGYRRMVLHYAHLAQMAGGIDTILIGSELRGLTTLRRSADEFPFVEGLVDLAADVRAVAGGATTITYAADWTEYSGFQPPEAPGDKLFHLDPLWASADIDAVGIDNYLPLADWRDGQDHADAALAASPHELAYLQGNIAGGEYYDWYYASGADREAGNRSPIADGAYSEPWVYRLKDLVNWWGQPHHNRIGGVRSPVPTAWVPEGKSIVFTELGCAAVDKGANLPSAFGDPKSSEDARPYFSNGTPDPLMQRQFLRAHHLWWRPDAPGFSEARNPESSVYAGRMVDTDRLYLWTWDARPYPAFPNRRDIWADGGNYAMGHWLTGRLGALGAAEMVAAIGADYGVEIATGLSGGVQVQGLQVDGVTSARAATGPLMDAADLTIIDNEQGLAMRQIGGTALTSIAVDSRVDSGQAITTRKRPDASAAIGRLGLSYLDRGHAYLGGSVTAAALNGEGATSLNSGLVIDGATARIAAERALGRLAIDEDTIEFGLPPSLMAFEAGDILDLEGQNGGPFVITELRDATYRRVAARALPNQAAFAVAYSERDEGTAPALVTGVPFVVAAHLPAANGAAEPSRLAIGALAQPWPGEIVIEDAATGAELVRLTQSAITGELTAPSGAGTRDLWDRDSVLELTLHYGHLGSAGEAAVLAGSNRLAVERSDGRWEIIGFAGAELVSGATYRLTNLLRGLEGTFDPAGAIAPGGRILMLDGRIATLVVPPERLDSSFALTAFAGRGDADGTDFAVSLGTDPLLPLAPAQLRAERDAASGDITLSWMRRTRLNGNSWALAEVPLDPAPEAYRITIYNGLAAVRTIETLNPVFLYIAAEQAADFGTPPANFTFTIAQLSAVFGAGRLATGVFNG